MQTIYKLTQAILFLKFFEGHCFLNWQKILTEKTWRDNEMRKNLLHFCTKLLTSGTKNSSDCEFVDLRNHQRGHLLCRRACLFGLTVWSLSGLVCACWLNNGDDDTSAVCVSVWCLGNHSSVGLSGAQGFPPSNNVLCLSEFLLLGCPISSRSLLTKPFYKC